MKPGRGLLCLMVLPVEMKMSGSQPVEKKNIKRGGAAWLVLCEEEESEMAGSVGAG